MSELFCPFINGNCNPKCMFHSANLEYSCETGCAISETTRIMKGLEFSKNNLESYLDTISNENLPVVKSIEDCHNKLDGIKTSLNEMQSLLAAIKDSH